jgi:hypothetical protein
MLTRAEGAAVIYSLIGTANLNGVDPQDWLADVLPRISDHRPGTSPIYSRGTGTSTSSRRRLTPGLHQSSLSTCPVRSIHERSRGPPCPSVYAPAVLAGDVGRQALAKNRISGEAWINADRLDEGISKATHSGVVATLH